MIVMKQYSYKHLNPCNQKFMEAETFWGQLLHASRLFTTCFYIFFNLRRLIQPFFEFEVKCTRRYFFCCGWFVCLFFFFTTLLP